MKYKIVDYEVNKSGMGSSQCVIALFPEKGYKRYLEDAVIEKYLYQQVKNWDE